MNHLIVFKWRGINMKRITLKQTFNASVVSLTIIPFKHYHRMSLLYIFIGSRVILRRPICSLFRCFFSIFCFRLFSYLYSWVTFFTFSSKQSNWIFLETTFPDRLEKKHSFCCRFQNVQKIFAKNTLLLHNMGLAAALGSTDKTLFGFPTPKISRAATDVLRIVLNWFASSSVRLNTSRGSISISCIFLNFCCLFSNVAAIFIAVRYHANALWYAFQN